MSKPMSGDAQRGAAKFLGCAVTVIVYATIILIAHPGPWKIFLYTLAAGVTVSLLWPTQEEGDALIHHDD